MAQTSVFHTTGRRFLGQLPLAIATVPVTNYYIGLRTLDGLTTHPADAAAGDTLGNTTTLAECAASGYARQAAAKASWTEAATGGNSLLSAPAVTFTFSAVQNGLTHSFWATTVDASGVLLASNALGGGSPTVINVTSGSTITETFTFLIEQGA